MIRVSLGAVGSGKTASEVRTIMLGENNRKTYSNIDMKGCKHNIKIDPSMIINKVHKKDIKRKNGDIEPVYDLKLNKEFWMKKTEPINIVLDEAHSIMNPRRAMSKTNVIVSDFLALIRRVLGSNDAGEGEAVFITQLPRRLDPITRDMANEVRYHICHYRKVCEKCNTAFKENSESPGQIWKCPNCGNPKIKKRDHMIEILRFASFMEAEDWIYTRRKTYFDRYYIVDIHKFFPYYDTMQWDNLFSEYY